MFHRIASPRPIQLPTGKVNNMGRKRVNPEAKAKQVSVSLPTFIVEMIDEECSKSGRKRSTVVLHALELAFGIGQN